MGVCRAYTLIELAAVTVIIAVMVSAVALNMQWVSDQARLAAAGEQISACFRLAQSEARRTGRPHGVLLYQDTCAIQRPVHHNALSPAPFRWGDGARDRLVSESPRPGGESKWRWEVGPAFDLVDKVFVEGLETDAGRWVPTGPGGWVVPVSGSRFSFKTRVRLKLTSGVRAIVELSGPAGQARVWMTEDSN